MTAPRDYDVKRPLRDVIGALLELVLPAEQRELIPRLTDTVSDANVASSTAASYGMIFPKARTTWSLRESAPSRAKSYARMTGTKNRRPPSSDRPPFFGSAFVCAERDTAGVGLQRD